MAQDEYPMIGFRPGQEIDDALARIARDGSKGIVAKRLVILSLHGFTAADYRPLMRAKEAVALFFGGDDDSLIRACRTLAADCRELTTESRRELIDAFAQRLSAKADEADEDAEWSNEMSIDLDAILAEVAKA